jgi:pimeloyl-ACP methyl ester carboxylesterase
MHRHALAMCGLWLLAVGCGGGGNRATTTAAAAPAPVHESCVRASERTAAISFRSTDGVRLVGILLGRGDVGVVLAHQWGGDLCQWLPFARLLSTKGYRVLAFDFRGYGSSPGEPNVHLNRDVLGAASELHRRGVRRIFLGGASMGGTAVLDATATLRPRAAAVFSLSAPRDWTEAGVDALAAVKNMAVPSLFATAASDRFGINDSPGLYRASATKQKRLIVVRGSEHGVELLGKRRVRAAIFALLAAHSR